MRKKLFTTLFAFILGISSLMAQEPEFVLGDQVVNAGIGFGSTYYTGSFYSSSVPPLSISYEKGIVDEVLEEGVIGIGGYLGYSSYKWEYMNWGYKYSNLMIGARGTFHYPLVDNLDTYTGLVLGYRIVSSKEFGNIVPGYDYSSASGGVFGAWFAGARYYFNDQFSVMGEIGYGIAYFTIGVGIKL